MTITWKEPKEKRNFVHSYSNLQNAQFKTLSTHEVLRLYDKMQLRFYHGGGRYDSYKFMSDNVIKLFKLIDSLSILNRRYLYKGLLTRESNKIKFLKTQIKSICNLMGFDVRFLNYSNVEDKKWLNYWACNVYTNKYDNPSGNLKEDNIIGIPI